jgi:uncharacterized membrane protein YqjE
MITNGRVREKEPNVATSMSELTHDVIELAELQAQLFALDVKSTTQTTRTSLILAVVGICLLLGSIPISLMAIAYIFIDQLEWSHAAGLAVAMLIGLAISGGFLAAGYVKITKGMSAMKRSRHELSRNIAFIKSSLRSQRHSHPAEAD